MPYIPLRQYEDKDDIYSPFVPKDPDSKTEDLAEPQKRKKHNNKNSYLIYFIIFIVIYYLLKHYKIV